MIAVGQHGVMRGSPYADLSRPPLSPVALSRALVVPGGLWTELRVVAETGSTNADVVALAQSGSPEGLIVVAEQQNAGRGRLDRRWQAPAQAGLTFSVLLRPAVPSTRLGWLPLLAGVAVVEALGRYALVDAVLKWPNDVLVRPLVAPPSDATDAGRTDTGPTDTGPTDTGPTDGDPLDHPYGKCAGILAEAVPDAVVLGIGLNVLQRADELPEPIDRAAFAPTSLALAGAALADRAPLFKAVLRTLAEHYQRWCEYDGDPEASGLAAAYRAACLTIGQEVTVHRPGSSASRPGTIHGQACDIDLDGRLVVASPEGTHALAAGDVHHVR